MYLLDTDICIQFMKNEKEVVNTIRGLENIHISVVTLAELFYGIYNSKNLDKHKRTLTDFLTNIFILNTNFSIANYFGKIKSKLKNKGILIGDFDILNAAFALTYDLVLITRNLKHYNNIKGIKIKTI